MLGKQIFTNSFRFQIGLLSMELVDPYFHIVPIYLKQKVVQLPLSFNPIPLILKECKSLYKVTMFCVCK
jgi:hypothetical protein